MKSVSRHVITLVAVGAIALFTTPTRADVADAFGAGFLGAGSVSARARLDFTVTLGGFISLRVGSLGTTVNTATIDLAPLATGCTAAPCNFGNGTAVAATYDGGFGAGGLPVEVKSNNGNVKLAAAVTTALTSGSETIPFSQIVISSSDIVNLPAPLIPNTGTGSAVNVAPSSFGITNRSANWKFAYANTVVPAAGAYSGQVTFTATAP